MEKMVRIKFSDISTELTEEEKKEMEALKNRPIVYDEDCPEMTEEQLKQFRPVKPYGEVGLDT